ncbi:hypothetical protein [Mucilaginibacter sp.]|uniref:hypothetical protein n=1 Tax=Mucilaginibacter sp. TaxID=1882438 RepID=UPI0035BC93F4
MKKNNRAYKTAVAVNNNPSNEVESELGAGAVDNTEALLKDEPSTGAFQEEATKDEPQAEQPITQGEVLQPIAPVAPVLPQLTIEEKLRMVEDLHRLTVQRNNLLDRIADLEEFEIHLMDEADELEGNHFSGCKLIIMANNGKQFVTNTSNLILKVADFIKESCYTRKAQIENSIVFPN